MKKAYVKPSMESEAFVPNTYVAACGDSGTIYKFKCDAGGGIYGSVYKESNGQSGLQTQGWNADERIATYSSSILGTYGFHACGSTHEADSDDVFSKGYYCPRGNTKNPIDVIIWEGPWGNDVHCTTELDMDKWETVKS